MLMIALNRPKARAIVASWVTMDNQQLAIASFDVIASTNLEGHQNSPIFEDVVVSSFAYVLVQGDELEFGE